MPKNILIPYAATGAFSHTVLEYLAAAPALSPYYSFAPDKAGITAAIQARSSRRIDRKTLVEVLRDQYSTLPAQEAVTENIARLLDENTFTVCTAHQPNLATGYLYFVYKILHAVKLTETLRADFPDRHFVPVYYMGSEDADLDELGTFRYGDKKFVWDADGQKGAVGHMRTASLKPLLDELFSIMGPPGAGYDALKELLTEAYLNHDTVAGATQYLVHALFGQYGLIVLNPDDARLKRAFLPVMRADLLQQKAEGIVRQTIESLAGSGFKAQAHPRGINLFYLYGGARQRIAQSGDGIWQVVDTDIRFSQQALEAELEAHPERFSPNVILRPLYQETILPDVAFIGGGAEVAYWLQLKGLFEAEDVFYPAIILRQSFLWINKTAAALHAKTGLSPESLFKSEDEIMMDLATASAGIDFSDAAAGMLRLLSDLGQRAIAIDPTLERSAGAATTKMLYQLEVLEKKAIRAQKKKLGVEAERISRLKAALFPNGSLQERSENFIPYYLQYGPDFFDALLAAMPAAYLQQFAVIEM